MHRTLRYYYANHEANKAKQRARYPANREKRAAESAARYKRNPEAYRIRERKFRAEHPEKARAQSRRYRGLPDPTRPRPDNCENCGHAQQKVLNLDHCHKTGIFRGWLCDDCNLGLGRLGDDIDGLLRTIHYLAKAYSA